uniref:Uncharacterized protein n=1 Tax=Ascaris lumbricoides TaxID=6252 RepID=A0A9J2PSV7_ASCLU
MMLHERCTRRIVSKNKAELVSVLRQTTAAGEGGRLRAIVEESMRNVLVVVPVTSLGGRRGRSTSMHSQHLTTTETHINSTSDTREQAIAWKLELHRRMISKVMRSNLDPPKRHNTAPYDQNF